MTKKTELLRYCPPTKVDFAPFGTIFHVVMDNDLPHHLYIQTAEDAFAPEWMRLGSFLEKVFEEFLIEDEFIDQCLRLFQNNQKAQVVKLKEIIKHYDEK